MPHVRRYLDQPGLIGKVSCAARWLRPQRFEAARDLPHRRISGWDGHLHDRGRLTGHRWRPKLSTRCGDRLQDMGRFVRRREKRGR